ncbi:hypothetical protein ABPG73_020871 [Tetrahymena malaccensis]
MRNMQQTQQNNQKDSQIKLILNSLQLKQFYINHLTKLIRPFELRKHISILVVIINSLTLLSFIFKNENRNSIQNHEVGSQNRADGVFKFIKQFQLTPFIGNALNSNQIQLDVVPFILNSLFILALALAYAFREYDLTKYCGKYFQIYTTFYNKWPFYVFLNISLHLIKESSQKKSIAIVAISYLNVIFTLIIGYFLELQDFSYSFEESRNYLAKQQSKQRFFLLFLRTFLVFMYQFRDQELLAIYSFFYFFIEVLFLLFDDYYLSKDLNQVYFYLCASSLQISFCLLTNIYIFKSTDTILACIITVPLSIQSIRYYQQRQYQNLFLEFSNQSHLFSQLSESKFLKIIRILIDQAKQSQNSYLQRGQGIYYQTIIQTHESQCNQMDQSCFCNIYRRFQKNSLEIEEFSEQHNRQEYAHKVILQFLEAQIQNSNSGVKEISNKLYFSHLTYLYEVINNPTKVLVNIQKMSIKYFCERNNVSLIDLFYFQQLKLQILQDYKIHLFDSNIENQKLNMMEVILFDDKINICKDKLRMILFEIGHFYDFLSGNFINLFQIQKLSLPLINLNEELEQKLIELFQIHPQDIDLQYLTSIYIQLIDFQNRRVKEFQKAAVDLSLHKSGKYQRINEISQNSEKQCVIFASLIENEFLVKKTSNLFEKIFGYSQDFIYGKQLNILIPNMLKRHHNQMIQSFIDEQSMEIINQGERHLFGLDKKGFIFPMSLRIKLQVFENDLGVCALVQKKKQPFSYIFFQNDGTITDLSKKIYFDIFKNLGFKNGQQLNIFEMIPSFKEVFKNQQLNKYFSSILVVKEPIQVSQSKQINNEKLLLSPNNNYNLHYQGHEVFQIEYRFLQHSTKNKLDINYLEIDFYQKETNIIKRNFIIDQVSKQKSRKDSQSFVKADSQQNSDLLNSFQHQYVSTREFSQVFENLDYNSIRNKDDLKSAQLSFQKWQTIEKSKHNQVEFTPNQYETYKLQQQNNILTQSKQCQDLQINLKMSENQSPNNYPKSLESKYSNQNGLYDINNNNQDFQIQTLFSPNKMTTQQFEQVETILSPTAAFNQEKQLILANQSCEYQNFVLLHKPISINCNNLQEISLNYTTSQQQLNYQQSRNFIRQNQFNNLKQISYLDNLCLEEQNYSQDFPQPNKEPRSINFIDKDDIKQEQKNEIASVNSSNYSTEELMKRKMIKRIKQKGFTKGLNLMAFTGIAAFFILGAVSLIIYIDNIISLNSFINSFLKIDDAQYCFIDIMSIVALNIYQGFLGESQSFIIDSIDLQNQEIIQTGYQQYAVLQDYNSNLQKLVLGNESGEQLYELQNKLFQVQIYASGFYNNAEVKKNSTTTFEQSLQYTLMQYFYEITFYILHYEDQQEDFIWGNIFNFKERMKDLQLVVENYAKEQFNNMNLQQIYAIILFSIISAVLVFSVLPLNVYIQVQKEKILKLFGTFSPSTIEFQIKQIELGIQKVDQMKSLDQTCNNSLHSNKQSSNKKKKEQLRNLNFYSDLQSPEDQKYAYKLENQAPRYIQRQQDKRNRQIASFSNIPKFSFYLFFLGVITTAVLLVMPVLNIVQFTPFETESKATLLDRISLIDVFSLIIENQSPNMEQVYLMWAGYSPQTSYYFGYLQKLQIQNQSVFKQLQSLTFDLGVKRFNQGLFEDFYQNLLNQNACQVRQNYPSYFNTNVTEQQCNKIFNGILQRGLIFSIQKIFQTFEEVFNIYQIQDLNELIDEFVELQNSFSFIEFKLLIQIVSEIVNGIRSIKEFQNAAFNLSKQKSQNQSKLAEINQFSENSCVIYTSLIEKEFLIKNVSNQFDKIFGYTSEFIQGKQINILIPNLIKSQHNQMIQMFIDQSSMDIVCQGDRILFGLDQNGFIFHISLRMKIQASENDLGVCALVQKKKQIYSYIFFENEGTITDFSKKIFQDIYSSHGLNRQQQLNIFELIPSLQEMMKNLQFNMVFSSVLVIKEQYLNISSNNENYSQSLKQINNLYTENDEVFLIQFKLFSHKTKNNIDTNYIEIYFCQKELNQFKKSILIDQLNKQKIQRQSLMYQKQESLQTLDFTNSQQQQLFSTRDFSNVFQNSDQNTNKEDTKNQQNNYLKLQKKSGDVEQALNQNEFNQFQFLSNDKLHFKKYKDQIIIKNDENTNIHQRSYEQQQVYQNGNYDQQDQGFQVSMINSPNKMLTNTVENTEIILSPLCSQRQNQLFLINQSNECQNFNQLKENQKFQPEQNQQNSNNLQEISLQNISLYQYLNKQHSQNKIQVHYQNNLKQNSLIKNNYYEEKYASQDLTPAIRRKSQSLNFKEQEDFMQDQKNEIASANSSKQRTEQMMKRKMIKTIKKENCYNGIFLMVFTGILAFIILSIVSLVIYYENLNHLDSFVQSFLKIDNAIYCFIDIMKLIALKNYQSIIGGGYSFIIENSDLKRQEFQQTGYQQQITLNDYSVNFQNLILDNDSTNQLSYLQNKLFQVQTYSEGFYLHAQDEKNTTNTFQKSLQFTLMQYYYEITQYYLKTEEQQEDFIWGNIFNFKQRMKDLQLIVESYAKDQLDQMSLHQISELILFISISTLIVFSVLPLYAIIQIQKEKVLKLFGTFQPSTIEFQIKQIELGLLKIEQINILEQTNNSRYTNARSITQKKYVKQTRDNFQFKQQENEQKYENKCNLQIPLFIQRQKDKRNRQIASFSNIPKFNFILFFLGIIVVALLLLIPIINKTLFNPFETESKAILQDIISLLDVFSLIIENQAPQIEQTLVIGIGTPPQNSKYNNYLQQLQDENKQVFQYLQNLTTNLGVQRKNQGLFSDFYQNLLNQNVCQVRQNYPQYFNSNITESRCNKLFNGILQKGLIISIQQVFQTLQEIYQIYQIEDINELTLQFIKLQSSYSFIECQQLIQVISEVVNAIRQYQNEELQQYENILKHNLLYLFISQQVLICAVFLIGWLYLFCWFRKQLQSATKIFTLFHINLLYENDFIQTYFRKISQKRKQA